MHRPGPIQEGALQLAGGGYFSLTIPSILGVIVAAVGAFVAGVAVTFATQGDHRGETTRSLLSGTLLLIALTVVVRAFFRIG